MMKWFLILIPIVALAQTRNDYENLKIKTPEMRPPYEGPTHIRNNVPKPGFYSRKTDPNVQSETFPQGGVNNATSEPKYLNTIALQIFCKVENSMFPIHPKFKKVKWALMKGDAAINKGEVQTTSQGLVEIKIRSRDAIEKDTLKVDFEKISHELIVGVGPYEVYVKESFCRNK